MIRSPYPPLRELVPPGFWVSQLVGWGLLGVAMYLFTQGVLTDLMGAASWQVAARAALWAGMGLVASSGLLLLYRPLLAEPRVGAPLLARVLSGSLVAGLLWAVSFEHTTWPLTDLRLHEGPWERPPHGPPTAGPPDPPPPAEGEARPTRPGPRGGPPRGLGVEGWRRPPGPPDARLGAVIPSTLLLVAWSSLVLSQRHAVRLTQVREDMLRAQALATEARLEMLRYELNPHFLFNALNSINGAIDEDAARAKQMVVGLSELLRYTLHSGAREVSVGDELAIAKTYLGIEKIRFEERLEITWAIDPKVVRVRLPAMLLQPLVENAVKHGMSTSPMPLRVRVGVQADGEGLLLYVSNSGRLAEPGVSQGVGLRNLRERLSHTYGALARFDLSEEGGEVRAQIRLPGRAA